MHLYPFVAGWQFYAEVQPQFLITISLQECPPGYYTDYEGAASCDICPLGYYCLPVQPENATINNRLCPAGYYCLGGK